MEKAKVRLFICVVICVFAGAYTTDCPVNFKIVGILRKCCESVELPKGCQCYESSVKSGFTNSLFHKPLCPQDMGVRFLVYTRTNRQHGVLVKVGDSSVMSSPFQGTKPTKVVIHGFTDFAPSEWTASMVDALLNVEDVNVILVDWRDGARPPNYFQAVANTRSVGAMVARLIQKMYEKHGALLKDFHLIGHSLGAHVCGAAGKEVARLTSSLLGRISGLDPAGFCFNNHHPKVRLDKSDAAFVDVIHTDAEPFLKPGLGIQHSIGHVDFYPNGGQHQPGCPTEKGGLLALFDYHDFYALSSTGGCSHSRCLFYYIDSISTCTPTPAGGPEVRCIMGYHTNSTCRGDFFPQTTDRPPFC